MARPAPGRRLLAWLLTPDLRPSRTFLLVALVAYAALVFGLIAFHEPWRDEADAWLAARDLAPGELRAFTRSAGTPALWYLLLAPLARSGAPYEAMFWLHGLLACGVAWLVLRHAPFSRPFKLLVVSSLLFSYEYAVVARSYALLLGALFGLAALHPARDRRPLAWGLLVGVLANSHALGAFFAAGIWLARVLELRDGSGPAPRLALGAAGGAAPRPALGLAVGAAGGLLAAWTLWPHPDGQALGGFPFSPLDLLAAVGQGFGPVLTGHAPWASALLGAAVLACGARSLGARGSGGLPLTVGLLLLALLFATTLRPSLRHVGLVPALLLYGLWVQPAASRPTRRARRSALVLWALVLSASVPGTVQLWIGSVYYASSGSTEMAAYLRANDLDRRPLAIHGAAIAVLPYLRRQRAYDPGIDAEGSFQRWDRVQQASAALDGEVLLARTRAHFRACPALLLLGRPLPEQDGLRLLYVCQRTPFRHADERFWLYRVDPR